MPHRVASWLKDIRSRILRVQAKIEGLTLADYEGDLDLREICERNLSVIGEGATQLRNNHIEWASRIRDVNRICNFRNVLVHESFKVNDAEVWLSLQERLIPLLHDIEGLLDESSDPDHRPETE